MCTALHINLLSVLARLPLTFQHLSVTNRQPQLFETTLQHVKIAYEHVKQTQREDKEGGSDSTLEEHVIKVNENQ